MLEYITDEQRRLAGGAQSSDGGETFSVGTDLKGADIRTLNTVGDIEEVVGDCCEDLGICEFNLSVCESENDQLQQENDALSQAAQDETSEGSEGNRISVATHIFDYSNATIIQTDVWKYEMWTTMSGTTITFKMRKTEISRSPNPAFPQQSGIRVVRPDDVTGDDSTFIQASANVSSGLLDVGKVWKMQYVFEDAKNYVGDTNIINTGFIDVITATIVKDISPGFDPDEIYVEFQVLQIGNTFDTKSGASI